MTDKDATHAKLTLEDIYRSHHERGKRYGYLYCHGERGLYLSEWIGKGKTVLDLGCRDGELTRFFARGNTVTGADIDRKALELARGKYGIETLWLDLNAEFPFEKGAFDVVVACEIVEHIYYTNAFLEKVSSILKPGGMFIGSVPNSFRMRNRLKFLAGKEFDTDQTHVHMFSHDKLKKLLARYFKDIRIAPIGGKILPFLKVSKYTPGYLNRLFGRDLLWKAVK
ncbi:MAG TPA: class I SAM-dependent methyltransferase [Nitrospirae bacterium]|nr:putative S-adenosylmethionine-dependent methyltransferase/MSMEI_2290 [bacterium BMS3Abin10]GBE39243.1 putative S-adenosylmethionine-dependent methyltransferase/MSMEI_2290 [bacterium BMS3Bbin08]HDH50786.1 class I SAM-dependent methyltransferase [Nitrospirota bacterium]HDK17733.1 class I SAM-dependent methyltransferase [Nitrospirota bacterium]HDK82427.1 class I SAM-dependent methyltransferase [Nitrospirota bacterium]